MKPVTDARPHAPRALHLLRRFAPFIILAVLAAAGWYGWKRLHGGSSATTYTTVPAARGSVLQTVTASGTLSPVVRSTVGSQVSGRITEILVDFNDQVKKGQVLARLDKQVMAGQVTQAQARVTSAHADLARAQATAANARLEYQRDVTALEVGAVSRQEVDAAKAAKLVAEASIESARSSIVDAEAALANAKTNLGYTTITSPIDGVVISRSVDAGQTVAASLQAPELFVIAGDLSKMELHAAVAEADVGQLKDGLRVELAFDAFPDRTFNGVVEQVRNQATTTQNVVTYDAVVAVDNADGALRPGMSATATFVIAEAKDVLVVSAKALRYRPASARTATTGAAGRTWGQGQGRTGGQGRRAGTGGSATGSATAATGSAPPATGGAAPMGSEAAPAGGPAAGGARRGPSPAVWILRDGAPVRVAVETGLSDGNQTAITGGDLKEGDLVITGDSSQKSTPAGAGAAAGSAARAGGGRRGPPSLF